MEWNFEEDSPIYLQIVSQFKARLASGLLSPGDKIASVRELAIEAGVNPNTMQKALSELEREGILYSKRTAGRFVAENSDKIHTLQQEMVKTQLENFVSNMARLGYSLFQTKELFEEYCRQNEQTGNNCDI